jgi:hypothetical protein
MLNVEKLFEPIAIETLINGVYNYFLMGNVIHFMVEILSLLNKQ